MTFSTSTLLRRTTNEEILSKPKLISQEERQRLGNKIKLVGIRRDLLNVAEKSFSPRLLNWVEPYSFLVGPTWTLFYTEVNSGLKVGDRVFIINGTYDSDLLIKKDKYKKGRDGYKVLWVENCKIVLNIKYTGELPWKQDVDDNFIGLYYIRNSQDFAHANRQITTRGGNFDYKFNQYQNTIVFADQDYPAMSGWGQNAGLTGTPGFYVKNGTYSWINITSQFEAGSFSIALSPTYSTNYRLKVYNSGFTASIGVGVVEFKEGFIYKYDMKPEPDAIPGTASIWIPDVTYNRPIITKGNFRDGNFKSVWNTGLFGRQDKRIKWEGDTSTWNAGTLLNTLWVQGKFNSSFSLSQSFFAELDENGKPYQKQNRPNNNGNSFNYIIDSDIKSSTIQNAIIYNTTLGETFTYSVMESHLTNTTLNFNNKVLKATFEECNFTGGLISNSEIKNSRAVNTYLNNVKTVNSDFKLSVIKDSTYISDEVIKILGYDEFVMSMNSNSVSHKVYKFYISEKNYHKLKIRDRFYIKGVKTFNNVKYPLNLFERRFRVQTWTEYIDFFSGDLTTTPASIRQESFYKRGIEIAAFLSTPEDNSWKFNSIFDGSSYYSSVIATQSEKRYSVDVVFSIYDKESQKVEITSTQNTFDIPISGLNYNYDDDASSSTSLTMSTFIGNVVDVSEAYILESDFESGIIESSNWNSGYHINYNNDVNITENTNEGYLYNLLVNTVSSTLIATTTHDLNFKEAGENCLSPGNVVFLHSIDYDTVGKIDGFIITGSGSNYQTTTGLTVSSLSTSGTGSKIDIVADTIGAVLSITYSLPSGIGYLPLQQRQVTLATASGTGLVVNYYTNTSGNVQSVTISFAGVGSGFSPGDILEITEPLLTPISLATFSIETVTTGGILSATISTGGRAFEIGEILTVSSGDSNATIQVTSTTGSVTRLPESYKITNNTNGVITMTEVGNSNTLSKVLDQGIFYTTGGMNRYGYIYKAKIDKSKIKSGIFRRAFIKNSLIEDLNYDLLDRDFSNITKIKNLLLSDILFLNTGNILSNATYMNSHIFRGSDTFRKGIVYKSLWKGSTFSEGIFEEGTWMDGNFTGGLFYESRSFDGDPGTFSEYYDKNNTWTYFRDGLTTATISNNRISWQLGTFSGGEFYKSDWENGKFTNGKLYNSKWYSGEFYKGTIGDNALVSTDTFFYNGTIYNAVVENAYLYAIDSSLYGLSNSSIMWYNGIFNDGVFGSDIIQYTASHAATWSNGTFNSGEFRTLAKWKNGTFNGGKFTSKYGWDLSTSTTISDYSWEKGKFNGGEFGVGNKYFSNYKDFYENGNPTWYTGEFNGGTFKGRVWNDGIFAFGDFEGSATISVVAALGTTSSSADLVSNQFRETGIQLQQSSIPGSIPTSYAEANGVNVETYSFSDRVWYLGILWECATSSVSTATPSTTYFFDQVDLDVYLSKYYGLWRNGIFTNVKDKFIKDKKIFTQIERGETSNTNIARTRLSKISNIVWQNGTFSHTGGEMLNSVWQGGIFENGYFRSSSFNPYVRRNSTNKFFNYDDDTCYWDNGQLIESDFYISRWKKGNFISGTGYGMIFEDGVVNYMNAFNVFWENGIWKNGNWYGSFYDVFGNGEVTDPFVKEILFRGMSWSGTSSTHVWNIFIEQIVSDSNFVTGETASGVSFSPQVIQVNTNTIKTKILTGLTPVTTSNPNDPIKVTTGIKTTGLNLGSVG